jgi:hypothetical protein
MRQRLAMVALGLNHLGCVLSDATEQPAWVLGVVAVAVAVALFAHFRS